jgi:ribonuclease BN (tRNA processing enzyme)
MHIKILGTRGKIEASKPYHSKHTGYLVNEELLIDVGEEEYMQHDPKAVVFTHLHPDHAYFVENGQSFEPDIPVYAPEESEHLPSAEVIDGSFSVKEYNITPIPVIHSLKVKSWAYIIEHQNDKLFISGDLAWIEKKHHDKINGADLIITEASFIKKGGRIRRKEDKIFGHTGVPDLVRIFSPLTDRIVFTHYGSWFIKDVPEGKKKIKALEEDAELIPAYDGMEIEL